tara:strand:+ start:173 stop:430 length:258 start_codon:yes stop_codon:yes gene_type:complete
MKATKENPLIWYANCYFDYTAFDYVLEKVSTKYKTSEGIERAFWRWYDKSRVICYDKHYYFEDTNNDIMHSSELMNEFLKTIIKQ